MTEEMFPAPARDAGGKPSIVTSFGIRGLYGYKTISLSSDFAATILIARNGSGKTTLLAALDAFLRRQFFRLKSLPFDEIFCTLRGVDEELVLRKTDLDALQAAPDDSDVLRLSRRLDAPPAVVFRFLTEEWPLLKSNYRSFTDHKFIQALMTQEGYAQAKVEKIFDDATLSVYQGSPDIALISATLEHVLGDHEIVYLPTYRRVELALSPNKPDAYGRRVRRPRLDVEAGSIFSGEIQFGLADISERLEEMNTRIVGQSNSGYRKISANIINDLLDGNFRSQHDDRIIPSKDDLSLFFSRIENRRTSITHYPVSPPNLDRIYSPEGVPPESLDFLQYFLSQLDTVIEATREVERSAESFIENCNRYLCSYDPTTAHVSSSYRNVDAKRLVLSRKNLRVAVESIPEGRKISLNALSSGEKQMISLFAKLYLYPKPKIILIDEPELSLSIDWQRNILVDIINAPLSRQTIAITHSPFVFDNELEPFARSLTLKSDSETPLLPTIDEDLFDNEFDADHDE